MLINKEFPINLWGVDYVVSDLHGQWMQLDEELQRVSFDKTKDRLFSVGDLIDRGPQSFECLQLLDQPWFHPVVGNHEDFLMNYFGNKYPTLRKIWWDNGGDWIFTLTEKQVKEVKRYAQMLETSIPLTITLKTVRGKVGIVHAEPGVTDWDDVGGEAPNISSHDEQKMLWGRSHIKLGKEGKACKNIDLLVHGHTIVSNPKRVGNSVFIDTGSYLKGKRITLLPIEDLFGV